MRMTNCPMCMAQELTTLHLTSGYVWCKNCGALTRYMDDILFTIQVPKKCISVTVANNKQSDAKEDGAERKRLNALIESSINDISNVMERIGKAFIQKLDG